MPTQRILEKIKMRGNNTYQSSLKSLETRSFQFSKPTLSSFSAMFLTATLDWATNQMPPCCAAVAESTYVAMTVVFPVPGGPWMMVTLLSLLCSNMWHIASCWESLIDLPEGRRMGGAWMVLNVEGHSMSLSGIGQNVSRNALEDKVVPPHRMFRMSPVLARSAEVGPPWSSLTKETMVLPKKLCGRDISRITRVPEIEAIRPWISYSSSLSMMRRAIRTGFPD